MYGNGYKNVKSLYNGEFFYKEILDYKHLSSLMDYPKYAGSTLPKKVFEFLAAVRFVTSDFVIVPNPP